MNPRAGLLRIDLVVILAAGLLAGAMAAPLLRAAERNHNERCAIVALKTLTTAEADFRSNDRDGNRSMDFWTADVYAFYGMIGITGAARAFPQDAAEGTNHIQLITKAVAAADGRTDHTLYGNLEFAAAFETGRPSRGYFFRALHNEVTGGAATTLLNDTDGRDQFYEACHDNDRFAFIACPVSLKAGRMIFVVNEDNTLWQYALPKSYGATFTGCAGAATDSTSTTYGTGLAAEFALAADPEQGTFPAAPAAIGCAKVPDAAAVNYDKALEKSALSFSGAMDAALKEAKDGVVVKAELEMEDGQAVFIVDVARKDSVLELRLAAKEGAAPARSTEYEDWSELASDLKVTAKQAVEAAEKDSAAKAVAIRLMRAKGALLYAVSVWKDGRVKRVTVDAEDGSVK